MRVAEAIIRKSVLAGAVFVAGPQAHLQWGYEYQGPGMNQLELLCAVTFVAALLAGLFLLFSIPAAIVLRRRSRLSQYAVDLLLFAMAFALSVWAGVSAQIV